MKENETLDDYCIRQAKDWRMSNPERHDLCVGWSLPLNRPLLEVYGMFGFVRYEVEKAT